MPAPRRLVSVPTPGVLKVSVSLLAAINVASAATAEARGREPKLNQPHHVPGRRYGV